MQGKSYSSLKIGVLAITLLMAFSVIFVACKNHADDIIGVTYYTDLSSMDEVRHYVGSGMLLPMSGDVSKIKLETSYPFEEFKNGTGYVNSVAWEEQFNNKKLNVILQKPMIPVNDTYDGLIEKYEKKGLIRITDKKPIIYRVPAIFRDEDNKYIFVFYHKDQFIKPSDERIGYRYYIEILENGINAMDDALIIDYVNSLTYGD